VNIIIVVLNVWPADMYGRSVEQLNFVNHALQ